MTIQVRNLPFTR